jgi:quercetin dioxygenase-like cupin family protein
MGYHSHALDFQMNYLLKGWARLDFEDIGEVRVEAGDAWYQPPGIKHEVLEYSDDFEVIEIAMPAEFPTQDESR